MDRRARTFIQYAILISACTLLTACQHNKDSGTSEVSTETTEPFIRDTFPTTDVTTASTNQIITITFSEAIREVNTDNIRIAAINSITGYPETALLFPKSVLVLTSQDTVLEVQLADANINLKVFTHYLVVIEGIVDYAGNVMSGICEFIFATTGANLTVSLSGPCKPQPGIIGFKEPVTKVAENNSAGQVEIIVKRINGSDGVVSVDYQTNEVVNSISATLGSDYTTTSGTLIFNDGVTELPVYVPILDDNELEGDEVFNVSLTSISTNSAIVRPLTAGAYPSTTISITDDEISSSNVIKFIGRSRNINENIANGLVEITVSRVITKDSVSVDFSTIDGLAKQGVDYQVNQGTLNFAVGESTKIISVNIIDDKIPELLNSFTVVLSNPVGTRLVSSRSIFEVFINDDDQEFKPEAAVLSVTASLKKLNFSWSPINPSATYNLLEMSESSSGYKELKIDLTGNQYVHDISVYLKDWPNTSYKLQTCINAICSNSNVVFITEIMLDAIGYFKPSNTGLNDNFGSVLAMSDDGLTLAVGTPLEDSDLYGVVQAINVPTSNPDNNNAIDSGVVYIYSRVTKSANWQQTAYIKASNVEAGDHFGASVALSGDGLTLAVGAQLEDSAQTGTLFNPSPITDNNAAIDSGAVYVFTRTILAGNWIQQAYIKASNTGVQDNFGKSISLSYNGNLLVISAHLEDSVIPNVINLANNMPLINNTEITTINAGAVYVFSRATDTNSWSQQSYLKSTSPDPEDFFGNSIDLSGNGSTIIVGAYGDDAVNNAKFNAGAYYIFTNNGIGVWSQLKYIPALASASLYGWSVSISHDATTYAISTLVRTARTANGFFVRAGAIDLLYIDKNGIRIRLFREPFQPNLDEEFGANIALSGDGRTFAIGIPGDDGDEQGVSRNIYNNNLAKDAGNVIIYKYDVQIPVTNPPVYSWIAKSRVKASNTNIGDRFGSSVVLDFDGDSLAVGAIGEASKSTGVKNNNDITIDPTDNQVPGAGAVYIY